MLLGCNDLHSIPSSGRSKVQLPSAFQLRIEIAAELGCHNLFSMRHQASGRGMSLITNSPYHPSSTLALSRRRILFPCLPPTGLAHAAASRCGPKAAHVMESVRAGYCTILRSRITCLFSAVRSDMGAESAAQRRDDQGGNKGGHGCNSAHCAPLNSLDGATSTRRGKASQSRCCMRALLLLRTRL